MKMLMKFAAGSCLALSLVSCGGGGDGATLPVAGGDTTVGINPTTGPAAVQAISGETFTFGAVPVLNTTSPTTLKVDQSSGSSTFTITSPEGTAVGNLSFGSCIFTVQSGNSSALPKGATVTVNPCNIKVRSSGLVANGLPQNAQITITLAGAESAPITAAVVVNANGTVVVKGASIGNVTLKLVTGTS